MRNLLTVFALLFSASCQDAEVTANDPGNTTTLSARVERAQGVSLALYDSAATVLVSLKAGSYYQAQTHPFSDGGCDFNGVPIGVPYTLSFKGLNLAGIMIWSGAATGTTASSTINGGVNATMVTVVVSTPITGATGSFTDTRDGQIYEYVTIGTQIWMAQNLNYAGSGNNVGGCYNNNPDSCAKYGRLYTWAEVMNGAASSSASPSGVQGISPTGWHVPSDAEWTTMQTFVEPTNATDGTKLKSTSGWLPVGTSSGNGTDTYGFRALPGGIVVPGGSTHNVGYDGYWWSSTEFGLLNAWYRDMGYGQFRVHRYNDDKADNGFSLRCVANQL